MKKLLLLLSIVLGLGCLMSCTKHETSIRGKFMYDNGERGTYRIWNSYEFLSNGRVYNERQVGNTAKFTTEGCSLYYTLEGEKIVIYHGTMGWKKEVQNTPYASGVYYGDYMVLDGDMFVKQ